MDWTRIRNLYLLKLCYILKYNFWWLAKHLGCYYSCPNCIGLQNMTKKSDMWIAHYSCQIYCIKFIFCSNLAQVHSWVHRKAIWNWMWHHHRNPLCTRWRGVWMGPQEEDHLPWGKLRDPDFTQARCVSGLYCLYSSWQVFYVGHLKCVNM
jgi:hypothetical protein